MLSVFLKLIDSKTLRATLYPAGFSTGLSLPLNCLMSQHHCQGFLENSFTCLITLKSAYCPRDKILIVVTGGEVILADIM